MVLYLPQIIKPRPSVSPADFGAGNTSDDTSAMLQARDDGRPIIGHGITVNVYDDIRFWHGAELYDMVIVDKAPERSLNFRTVHYGEPAPFTCKGVRVHIDGDGKTGKHSESAGFWISQATWADLDIGISGLSQGNGIQIASCRNVNASLWSDSFQYVSDSVPSDDIMTVFNITQCRNVTLNKLISKQGGGIVGGLPFNRLNRALAISDTHHLRPGPSLANGNFYLSNSGQLIDITGSAFNLDIHLKGGVLLNAGSWAIAAKNKTRHSLFEDFYISDADLGAVVISPKAGSLTHEASGENIFRNIQAHSTGSTGYWSGIGKTVASFKVGKTGGTGSEGNLFDDCHSFSDAPLKPDYGFWSEVGGGKNSHSGCSSQGHTQADFFGFN